MELSVKSKGPLFEQLPSALDIFFSDLYARHKGLPLSIIRKAFSNKKYLEQAWTIVGGPEGLARRMVDRSVFDISNLCQALAVRPNKHRHLREPKVSELLKHLIVAPRVAATQGLRRACSLLLPACSMEVLLDWQARPQDLKHTTQKLYSKRHLSNLPPNISQQAIENLRQSKIRSEMDRIHDLFLIRQFIRDDIDIGFQVLDAVLKDESLLAIDSGNLVRDLLRSLPRRCARRRDAQTRQQLSQRYWKTCLCCLKSFPDLRNDLFIQKGETSWLHNEEKGLLYYAITSCRLDGPHAKDNETILAAAFQLIPKNVADDIQYIHLVSLAARRNRYNLLRLFQLQTHNLDIGPVDQSGVKLPDCLCSGRELPLFNALPLSEALLLLQRAFENNQADELFEVRETRLPMLEIEPSSWYLDPILPQAKLLSKAVSTNISLPFDCNAVLNSIKVDELDRRRKYAATAREWETRAFWAKSALCLCICVSDLSLFLETMKWTRRFHKDAQAWKEIYSCLEDFMTTPASLFTSIRYHELQGSMQNELQKNTIMVNNILLEFIEHARLRQNEPDFSESEWRETIRIILHITERRVFTSHHFRKNLKMTDDDVFSTILQPTVEMLIVAEDRLLRFTDRGLCDFPDCPMAIPLSPSVGDPIFQFVDRWAEARNNLLRRHRSKSCPDVLTLPAPWPQGLPVHSLCLLYNTHWRAKGEKEDKLLCRPRMPYIDGRVEQLLFQSLDVNMERMPTEKEHQEAIGKFIEQWRPLLDIYLAAPTEEEHFTRIQKIWNHCLENITPGKVTPEESVRFWQQWFPTHCQVGLGAIQKRRVLPLKLPKMNTDSSPIEWNPYEIFVDKDKEGEPEQKVTEFHGTAFGAMLDPKRCPWYYKPSSGYGKNTRRVETIFDIPPSIEVQGPTNFWTDVFDEESKGDTNAIIAAALLYINSKYGLDTSILMSPYPSADKPTFPAIFLDEEFLEGKLEDSDVMNALERCVADIPPDLLVQLAASVYQRFQRDKAQMSPSSWFMVRLIEALLSSKTPSGAISLAVSFITDNPDDSSWHRRLFSARNLNSLSAADAASFTKQLTEALLSKRRESLSEGYDSGNTAKGKMPKHVKVTTFKMLANMVSETAALPLDTKVEILSAIQNETDHLDIQHMVLQGVSRAAQEASDSSTVASIMDIVRRSVGYRAASLNERTPEDTETFEAAIRDGNVLQVWEHQLELPPLLEWLAQEASRVYNAGTSTTEGWLVVLLRETIDESVRRNMAWIHTMLKERGIKLEANQKLPKTPVHPRILIAILNKFSTPMPRDIFDMMSKYVLMCRNPPKWFDNVNVTLKADKVFQNSNASRHWEESWNKYLFGDDNPESWAERRLVQLSAMDQTKEVQSDMELLEDFWLAWRHNEDCVVPCSIEGTINLWKDARVFDLSRIRKSSERNDLCQRIKDFFALAKSKEWHGYKVSTHQLLPVECNLELLDIQLPRPMKKRDITPEYASNLGNRVVALVSDLSTSGKPYHKQWDVVIKILSTDIDDLKSVAIIGSVSCLHDGSSPSLADYLRVELAHSILNKCLHRHDVRDYWDANDVVDVTQMVKDWINSPIREFHDVNDNIKTSLGIKEAEAADQ